MKTLVKYEFLKILRKKSTLIVMAVSLLLTAFLFGLPILQYQTYNADEVIKGLDGIAYTKEQYSQISVPLTDEYITETIREVQGLFENPDNVGFDGTDQFLIGDTYWNDIAPREELLKTIASTYAAPGVTAWYSSLPELDVTNGANFYQAREAKIATLLNDSSRGLSDEQKEYWQNMNSRVKTPFQYGSSGDRCGHFVGQVWKNKTDNCKDYCILSVWASCIYHSYPCGLWIAPCGVWC